MSNTESTSTERCTKCGESNEVCDGGYCLDCVPRLEIPEAAWSDPEQDGSRLYVAIRMKGLGLLHVWAFRVARVCKCGGGVHGRMTSTNEAHEVGCGNYLQLPDTPHEWMRKSYREFSNGAGQNEPWYELEIRGRRYVLFAMPGS